MDTVNGRNNEPHLFLPGKKQWQDLWQFVGKRCGRC